MKRKIELPATMEMRRKVLIQEELTKTEQLICLLANPDTDVAVLEALQEAYNQGYEDARPKWLPIESAPQDGTRYIAAYEYEGIWFCEVVGSHAVLTSASKVFPATHWLPLPEPPTR